MPWYLAALAALAAGFGFMAIGFAVVWAGWHLDAIDTAADSERTQQQYPAR